MLLYVQVFIQLCRLLKVLPSPLLLTERLNEEEPLAWPVSTLRSSRQPTVTASTGLLSQKKRFFYLFSRSPWTVMDSDRLQRTSRLYRPKLRCLFINCHTLRPQSMPLPKTVPISVCAFHSVPTARFANISLQASPTFRRSQRGHNMEVWASIDVVLLLGRAQMSTKKNIHQEIIFVSYFWLPDMAGLWILLSFPDLQQHLTSCLSWIYRQSSLSVEKAAWFFCDEQI